MKFSKTQIFRLLSLTFFIVIVLIASYRHQKMGGGPTGSPSVDTICPFGALETIYKVVAGNEFLKRTAPSNFILLAGSIILTIVLGRFFCGWICALGGLQEYTTKLRNITVKKRFIIPETFDKYLRFLKYVLLIIILFFTWKFQDMIIRPYDPFVSFSHIFGGLKELFTVFLFGTIILILSIILSFFFDRFFCKYLCPLGAFLSIIYKIFPFYKIKRDKSTCINCNKCSNVCPTNIPVAKLDTINKAECINCMECVSVCPTKKNTLKPTVFNFFIKSFIIGIVGLSIYLGAVLIGNITGIWKSGEETLSNVLTSNGQLNPYNIRGYMTLKDISNEFKIDIDKLYNELGISKTQVPENTKTKELSTYSNNLSEETVRDTVSKIIGYVKKESDISGENRKHNENSNSVTNEILPDPQEIKGSWKLKDILETYKISKEELYKELNTHLVKNTFESYNFSDDTTLKNMKEKISTDNPDFEVENIREAVEKLKK